MYIVKLPNADFGLRNVGTPKPGKSTSQNLHLRINFAEALIFYEDGIAGVNEIDILPRIKDNLLTTPAKLLCLKILSDDLGYLQIMLVGGQDL